MPKGRPLGDLGTSKGTSSYVCQRYFYFDSKCFVGFTWVDMVCGGGEVPVDAETIVVDTSVALSMSVDAVVTLFLLVLSLAETTSNDKLLLLALGGWSLPVTTQSVTRRTARTTQLK